MLYQDLQLRGNLSLFCLSALPSSAIVRVGPIFYDSQRTHQVDI